MMWQEVFFPAFASGRQLQFQPAPGTPGQVPWREQREDPLLPGANTIAAEPGHRLDQSPRLVQSSATHGLPDAT